MALSADLSAAGPAAGAHRLPGGAGGVCRRAAALWAGLVRALFRDPRAWLVAAATPAGLSTSRRAERVSHRRSRRVRAVQLDRRPRLVGMLIGALAIKPHLAALFPVALVASRRWQTLIWAAVSATVFTALGVLAFGVPTSLAFLHDLPLLRDIVDRAGLPWAQMPSLYVLILSLRAPPVAAGLAQAAAALAAGICVWRAWRGTAPFEAKAAALCVGSLLVSPYLFTYDLTWAALAIGFLAILGMRDGFGRGERDILFAAWLAPLAFVPLYWLLGVQLGCAAVVAILAVAMRRVSGSLSSSRP